MVVTSSVGRNVLFSTTSNMVYVLTTQNPREWEVETWTKTHAC